MVNWEVLQGVGMNSICAAGPLLWGQGCGSVELQEGEWDEGGGDLATAVLVERCMRCGRHIEGRS